MAFYGRYNPKSNTYTTGYKQKLIAVHSSTKCINQDCIIHNPSNHNMRRLKTYWRSDRGIMERICNHETGHPDPDSPWEPGSYQWVHGCCGCCQLDHPEDVVVDKNGN